MEKPSFVNKSRLNIDPGYYAWIEQVKLRYHASQTKAAIRVNTEMLQFYWELGRDIVCMKAEQKWGAKVVQQISLDLRTSFPNVSGFSVTNIKYTARWYSFYNQGIEIGQRVVDQLEMPVDFGKVPWGHHIDIVSKCISIDEALFYIESTIQNNWSRPALKDKLLANLYKSQGKAITNFNEKLPTEFAEKATSILKDQYYFDFVQLPEEYVEKDLEDALVNDITRFLLELGKGFAFVGRQMELRMPDGTSYYPDLIFYHYRIKSFVVCELKRTSFQPEHAGKLNFYVKAVDELLKGDDDNPTVGLLICRDKDKTTVEWSLSDIAKPLGVASYDLENALNASISARLKKMNSTDSVCRIEGKEKKL